MKLTVLFISASGKSALVAVESPIAGTPFSNKTTGWMNLVSETTVGASYDVPFNTVSTHNSVTDDGTSFTWISLS